MDKREILQRIIDEGGVCDQLYRTGDDWCKYCPMSKLKTRPDGTFLSCVDAVGVNDFFGGFAHMEEKYLAKAIELLSDILIDDMLRDHSVKDP